MKRMVLGFVAVLAAAVMGAAGSAPAAPLAAYGRLPDADHVAISPDGSKVAMATGAGADRQIQIIDIGQGKVVAFMGAARSKVRSVQWAGPDHLLVVTSETTWSPRFGDDKHEVSTAIVRDMKRNKWIVLLKDRKDALPLLSGPPMVRTLNGRPMLFFASISYPDGLRGSGHPALFRADLTADTVAIVAHGGKDAAGWVVDAQGRPAAREDYDEKAGAWSLWINTAAGWSRSRQVTARLDPPSLSELTPDGRSVLVREGGDDDTATWKMVSLADGAWSPEVAALKNTSSFLVDDSTGKVIGRTFTVDGRTRYSFDAPADQQAWSLIEKAFPGAVVNTSQWTADHGRFVVHVQGEKHGDAFYVVDAKTRRGSLLADAYPDIPAAEFNPVTRVDYDAKDGMRIPAYLTAPRGRPMRGLPLVVLVHGGPAAKDEDGFDWWAQALASRGYAVLQPQYRGSSGWGDRLLSAGYGEWGRKMQTDVSDGVRALAAKGVIDPKRVCIAGASYGGYAAMAGATLDPEPYRCAVAVAGVSDITKMVRHAADDTRFEQNLSQRYWLRFMGLKRADDPHAREISPAAFAARVTMPVLLIHGLDDTVVPYDQSKIFADALRRAGKPVAFVTLTGEDHWLSRAETRQKMLQAMVDFLEKTDPPDPPVRAVAQTRLP